MKKEPKPIGTEFWVRKNPIDNDSKLVRCVITSHLWYSKDVGNVYNAIADEEVGGLDSNWNCSYSKETSACDLNFEKALNVDGKIIFKGIE